VEGRRQGGELTTDLLYYLGAGLVVLFVPSSLVGWFGVVHAPIQRLGWPAPADRESQGCQGANRGGGVPGHLLYGVGDACDAAVPLRSRNRSF
jgi:hypothetical protein